MPLIGDKETFNKNISRIAQMFGNIGMTKMEDRLARQRMAEQMKGYMDLEKERSANSLTQIDATNRGYMELENAKYKNALDLVERNMVVDGPYSRQMKYRLRYASPEELPTIKQEFQDHMEEIGRGIYKAQNGQDMSPEEIQALALETGKGFDSLAYGIMAGGQQKWKARNVDIPGQATQRYVADAYTEQKEIEYAAEQLRQGGRVDPNTGQRIYNTSERQDAIQLVRGTLTTLGASVDPNDPNRIMRTQPTKTLYDPKVTQLMLSDLIGMNAKLVNGGTLDVGDINYLQRVQRKDLVEKYGPPRVGTGLFGPEEDAFNIIGLMDRLSKRSGEKDQDVLRRWAVEYLNNENAQRFALPPLGQTMFMEGEEPTSGYSDVNKGVIEYRKGVPEGQKGIYLKRRGEYRFTPVNPPKK